MNSINEHTRSSRRPCSETGKETDELALKRAWSRANSGAIHTKDLTDLPSSRATFRTAGIAGRNQERRGGEEGYTGVYKGGVYEDDDVDNQNARQRHEEEEFLTLGAPMFAFLIG